MEISNSTFIYANKNIQIVKELSKHKIWVLYKAENGTKVPYQVNGRKASTTNPATWNTFEAVLTASKGSGYSGIGIVFSESLGITGIDIDECVDPVTKIIDPRIVKLINKLDSYTEYSHSGTGIHILVNAKIAKAIKKGICDNAMKLEMYTWGRYFTFTANYIEGLPLTIEDRQSQVDKLYSLVAQKSPNLVSAVHNQNNVLERSDQDIINIALKAKNGDKFSSLYEKGLTDNYSSPSEASQALVSILAFYTRDAEQIDRLFRQSALYRGKWIEKWERLKVSMTNSALSLVEVTDIGCVSEKKFNSNNNAPDPDDFDLAKDVIHLLGEDNIFYCQSNFWRWGNNLGYWKKENDLSIKQEIIATGHSKLRKVNTTKIKSTCEMLKMQLFKPEVNFDHSLETINCKNGELYFHAGAWVLKPHNRANYNTYAIPVDYKVDAMAPRYEQFKKEIFQNDIDAKEKSEALDEMMGYCLLKTVSFEKFFMLIGKGSNGKSVLLNVLTLLLGKNNVSAICPSSLGNKFKRAHLRSKLANIVSEMPEGHAIPDAEMKALVSGDTMNAEIKNQDPFDFRPFCKMIFATNHMPYTRDYSDAWFRRPLILEFNNKFEGENCDRQLVYKLEAELQGILNCALKGLTRLFLNQSFTIPLSSSNLLAQWNLDVNQVAQFIDEKCEYDSGNFVSTNDLFSSYVEFANDAGIKMPLNRNSFRNRLLNNDKVREYRTSTARGFVGLSLLDPMCTVRNMKLEDEAIEQGKVLVTYSTLKSTLTNSHAKTRGVIDAMG